MDLINIFNFEDHWIKNIVATGSSGKSHGIYGGTMGTNFAGYAHNSKAIPMLSNRKKATVIKRPETNKLKVVFLFLNNIHITIGRTSNAKHIHHLHEKSI